VQPIIHFTKSGTYYSLFSCTWLVNFDVQLAFSGHPFRGLHFCYRTLLCSESQSKQTECL